MDFAQLRQQAEAAGMKIDEEALQQFQQYAQLLVEWNGKFNLTAITDPGEIVEKHFLDCILPLAYEGIRGKAADVGSGAGFPGLVWKIMRKDLDITLIEPTGKRCTFLNEVIRTLDLKQIRVCCQRSEDHVKENREAYDVVTARAVANLRLLSELCVPLVKPGGIFVAMKGPQGKEEDLAAMHALGLLGAKKEREEELVLPCGDRRVNLVYRKVKNTPASYPRNYGQMKKKPL